MGKKAKVGKSRKDKFYHLAKETGYRARSAFKLIQLNRKFGFLQESRVVLDLCAAPGGWLQVASNFMPVSSIIIGIDLVSIKPIKNVTTFQADITTEHCRQLVKKELKSWKTDVVLNDGAPNVGSAWVQDAFTQAQLALSALKLASEFLKKGGWFITKVFRSKDYTALLWVFQQLFTKVHSTKPQASRSESAEIFVVCQGYLAPDKLDDKFLDPKHVFKEIQQESKIRLNLLKPEKQVRQREGYPENNTTLHTTIAAKEFIESSNAIDLLATANKIDVSDEKIKSDPSTTPEILECCQDIKVLGKKELKSLLTWRKRLRKILMLEEEQNKEEKVNDEVTEQTEEEKQQELDEMISDLKEQEDKDLKKKRKRVREQKKKLRERLAGKLADASGDTGANEEDLFQLKLIQTKKELEQVDGDNAEHFYSDESDDELEFESDENEGSDEDSSDEEYVYGADELYEKSSKKAKLDDQGIKKKKEKKKKTSVASENPLLVNETNEEDIANDENAKAVVKAKQWYQKDIFKDVEENDNDDDLDDEYDIELMLRDHKKKGGKLLEKEENVKQDDIQNGDDGDKADVDSDNDSDNDCSDSGDDSEIDDRSISQGRMAEEEARKLNQKASKKSGFEVAPQTKVNLGPEALALGTAMVTSRKRKRDIIDDAYNRYSYNDQNLPSWFVEDEAKHTVRHVPVTREEVEFYKQRLRDINARPIKKVIEAKAKKKSQMLKKLDRARRKAQGILDATDVSSREKQDQIKGIYKKVGLTAKKRPAPTFVVAKKGLAGKKYKRPANVKGSYKVVDPRMKKDLKAMKTKEKTKGRGKKKRGR